MMFTSIERRKDKYNQSTWVDVLKMPLPWRVELYDQCQNEWRKGWAYIQMTATTTECTGMARQEIIFTDYSGVADKIKYCVPRRFRYMRRLSQFYLFWDFMGDIRFVSFSAGGLADRLFSLITRGSDEI